ncbi:MAG: ribosomal RNA small subunit methyltransferase A [Waddliaceae bacterium]|nr:ribosomal RNA small subunit methyltransferase A [Waddliaceae bacterium]
MPIYRPQELRDFLNQIGMSPRKNLSQNFLIDRNVIKKTLDTASLTEDDWVVEIGPGPGALTESLLEANAHVYAIEKDRDLAPVLQRFDPSEQKLKVSCCDVLTFSFEEELQNWLPKGRKAKLIANLPYHLTTPILETLAPLSHLFHSLTVMVQDEVAQRFVAKPRTKEYGSFTLFLRYYGQPTYSFKVSRNCFYPPPKIDSAITHIPLAEPAFPVGPESFFKVTRRAFQQRRKTLRSSLKDTFGVDAVLQALKQMNLPEESRPEELSFEQFLELAQLINT